MLDWPEEVISGERGATVYDAFRLVCGLLAGIVLCGLDWLADELAAFAVAAFR